MLQAKLIERNDRIAGERGCSVPAPRQILSFKQHENMVDSGHVTFSDLEQILASLKS